MVGSKAYCCRLSFLLDEISHAYTGEKHVPWYNEQLSIMSNAMAVLFGSKKKIEARVKVYES